jgi:uncharacterized protein (TIGR02231 family)
MEIEVEAAIEAVTVYSGRAQVLRRAVVQITEAGEHTLRIGGLPQSLQRNSLRAQGRGPAGTRILGIEQESEIHASPPVEQLDRLTEEITRLRREIERTVARQKIIEEQREWLRTLGEQSARRLANGIAQSTARPEDASALFTYTSEEADRLVGQKLELATRAEELTRELEARERERRELSSGASPDRIAASVRIQVGAPGELQMELSYLIGGASWRPRYDARVEVAEGDVRLVEQALVWQQTGEEWRGIELSLSNARPSEAISLPDEPDPWYIDVEAPVAQVAYSTAPQPPAAPRFRAAALKATGVFGGAREPGYGEETIQGFAAMESADSMDTVQAEVGEASVERSGAAQVFRVPGNIDIPGDGAPHTLGLGEHMLPCRFEYVAAPVVAPGVHLRAIATNNTGAVLLPGELHVFHAGLAADEYVGATQLTRTAEGAEIKLYLGLDDNVTLKRELVERDTDKGSLLQSGIRRITFGYRATLANRTSQSQRIVYLDRLPVPRHERIKLRVLDLRPQPASRTRLEQLTWEFALAPDQEQRIEWRFVVEAPADLGLIGLP